MIGSSKADSNKTGSNKNSNNKNSNNKNSNSKKGRKRNGIGHIALDAVIICLAAVLMFSGYKVGSIVYKYCRDRAAYDNIAETARGGQSEGGSDAAETDAGDIDFDALREINPDVVAWIRCEGTVIDYPIVQGSDNSKYLHTLFDGSTGGAGTLFADAVTEDPFRQFNTRVYGHHMRDGSMFASLKKYKDKDYCSDHPEMELTTPEGRYRLQVWAFLNEPADSGIYTSNIYSEEERREYIDLVRSSAEYLTDADDGISERDRLVILSTCAYEYKDARYIAVCKML